MYCEMQMCKERREKERKRKHKIVMGKERQERALPTELIPLAKGMGDPL